MTVFVPDRFAGEMREALPGECAVWAAMPNPWAFARRKFVPALLMTIAAVLYFGFAHHVASVRIFALLRVWPMPGLLVAGACFYTWLWLRELWRARQVCYVLGDLHAAIVQLKRGQPVYRFNLTQLSQVEFVGCARGRGDILFERRRRNGAGPGSYSCDAGFVGVPDFSAAKLALREAIARAARKPG
jgi:hypothetical protein